MKSWLERIALGGFTAALLFMLLNAIFPFRVSPAWSREVTDRNGILLYAELTPDEKWRFFAPADQISPELAAVIVHKEDRWFFWHPGINPVAILRAAFNNIVHDRRTSGASTIPMQVARLLDPSPRTYSRKILEIFRALQLSMLYDKQEILQLYLNLVPYGGNIEGIRAASLLYLDKSPAQLSPAEIAALAVVPNRPGSLRPGKHNDELIQARNAWLLRYGRKGIFTEQEVSSGLKEPFEPRRHSAPREAPHLVRRLLSEHPGERVLISTLDAEIQQKVERILKAYVLRLSPYGIRNACAMVVDNRTAEVLAYVGSADFSDPRDGGQVDGLQALRSPGSALKPLLYAMAMDSGIITPKSVLLDVPTDFQGYRPANFDQTFSGPVSAGHALAQSLNLPAVRLLNVYGVEAFRQNLEESGCRSMGEQQNRLGLSLVLGGCGIRPEEMALLYAGLANRGVCRPLRLVMNHQPAGDSVSLLSEAAAWSVGDILTQLIRPDLPQGLDRTEGLPMIAWKTGTSYGRRDAWSVGFNTRYTIVVWSGNFSGQGVPELTGAGVAAPLLFDLFKAVDQKSGKTWFPMPESLRFRYVCSRSGLPPGEGCTDQVMDYFIPLVSPGQTCRHLQEVRISIDHKMSYCMNCSPQSGYALLTLAIPDPELRAWYVQEGKPFDDIPPHNPNCQQVFAGEPPRIISPVAGLTYLRYPGAGQVQLACQAGAGIREVFWYVNDRFYGSTPPEKALFFNPLPGRNKISCADDKGRSRDVWIEVEALP